jgi:predicted Zn-dependent protease
MWNLNPHRRLQAALLLLAGCRLLSCVHQSSSNDNFNADKLSVGDISKTEIAIQAVQTAQQTEFTPKEEYLIGREVAARILSTYKVYQNDKATQYLNLIGKALTIFSDRPETYGGYHFLILDSDDLNSFSAPGGFIFVTRGILRLSTSEDMIAGILSYSISHVVMKSGLNAIKESRKTSAFQALAIAGYDVLRDSKETNLDEKTKNELNELNELNEATMLVMMKGLTKNQVLMADRMALTILNRSGYDAKVYLDLLNLVSTTVALEPTKSNSSFPTWQERIAIVESALKTMRTAPQNSAAFESRLARFREELSEIR